MHDDSQTNPQGMIVVQGNRIEELHDLTPEWLWRWPLHLLTGSGDGQERNSLGAAQPAAAGRNALLDDGAQLPGLGLCAYRSRDAGYPLGDAAPCIWFIPP